MNVERSLLLLLLLLLPSLLPAAPSLTARLDGPDIVVEIDGALFTRYHAARSLKKPYLWPLVGPRSGTSVTTQSSEPYPHHNSLWFGCDHLNGRDYWHHQRPDGAILSQGPRLETAEGDEVVFTDVCDWSPRDGDVFAAPVLRDYRRIAVRAPGPLVRTIDFTTVLVPLTQVTITKTNHSLFALRMAPELAPSAGGIMLDAEGRTGEKATFGRTAAWLGCFGTRAGVTEGAALLQHPGNRWHPSPWFTRDYGFLSPTPMQWLAAPLVLGQGEPVLLAYRVVVHAGTAAEAGVDARCRAFAAERPPLPRPFLAAAIDQLPEVKAFQFGQSRKPLAAIERAVSLASGQDAAGRGSLVTALAAALRAPDATPAGRRFLCGQLALLGGAEAVAALAGQLASTEEHVAETAALSLGQEGSPSAAQALADALPTLSGGLRRTAVGCLGETAAPAVPTLAALLADPEAGEEAAAALARIANPPALLALQRAWEGVAGAERERLAASLLRGLAAIPPGETPRDLCRRLATDGLPARLRPPLLHACLRLLPPMEARAAYRQALADPAARSLALARAADVADPALVADACADFPRLPGGDRLVLLQALAARGDRAFAGVARAALADADAPVAAAASAALAILGGPEDVPALLGRASQEGGGPALAALERIAGAGVADAIGAALVEAEGKPQAELAELLVRRGEPAGAKWLLKAARSADRSARKEALRGLALLGDATHRDAILAMLEDDLGTAGTREPYEHCAAALLRRFPGPEGASARCLARLADAPVPARASLLRVLGLLGEPAGLAALVEGGRSADASLRDASIRALATWPTADAFPPLLEVARTSENLAENVLALRGCRRLLATMAEADSAELEKLHADCRQAARRDEERALFVYAPGGVAVNDLRCAAAGTYRIRRGGLRKGASWTTDRQYTFTEIPPELVGCTYIETVMDHRAVSAAADFLVFEVEQPVEILVGFDNRCRELPPWLKTWERTPMVLRTTTASCHLVVYRKRFPPGPVAVGGAKAPGVAAMYTVILRAAE